jgi:hypothetical protein
MKIMDALLERSHLGSYLLSEDTSLYIGNEHLYNCWILLDDTLRFMKAVPHPVRKRFVELILFLKKNEIDQCAWDPNVGTWAFAAKRIRLNSGDDERWIFVNVNEAMHENILIYDDILDERGGLVLSQPDDDKFKKLRLPISLEKYK